MPPNNPNKQHEREDEKQKQQPQEEEEGQQPIPNAPPVANTDVSCFASNKDDITCNPNININGTNNESSDSSSTVDANVAAAATTLPAANGDAGGVTAEVAEVAEGVEKVQMGDDGLYSALDEEDSLVVDIGDVFFNADAAADAADAAADAAGNNPIPSSDHQSGDNNHAKDGHHHHHHHNHHHDHNHRHDQDYDPHQKHHTHADLEREARHISVLAPGDGSGSSAYFSSSSPDVQHITPTTAAADDAEKEKVYGVAFCSCRTLCVALVPIICGVATGYPLGYVGVYTQLRTAGMDCARYAARGSCESAPFADCRWYTDGPAALPQYCGWNTHTCRVQYPNAALGGDDTAAHDACLQDHTCLWSHADNECTNPVGYSTAFAGVFAGSVVLGNMFGSIIASQLIQVLGVKLSFTVAGAASVIASVMCHVDVHEDIFWIMSAARFVMGFFTGFITVASPLYVSTNAHPSHRRVIGSFFQISTTVGVLINAVIAAAVGQTIGYGSSRDQHVAGRMQGLCAAQTVTMLSLMLLGIFIPEKLPPIGGDNSAAATATTEEEEEDSLEASRQRGGDDVDHYTDNNNSNNNSNSSNNNNEGYEDVDAAANHTAATTTTTKAAPRYSHPSHPAARVYTYREMFPQILKGILACATFRFTGFNAILNFAPIMMGGLGLAPLEGNIIVMIVNTLGTLLSIPLLRFVKARPVFLFGSCFISAMCLFLCGIPVYPGVASERITNIVGVVGIVLFIFAYEVFVGPAFYLITQDLFPPAFRAKGNSIAQTWQFLFNLVINVCYSIAVESFSGGPQGNQHKGQAIVFIFFGCIGFIFFILELFFMKPYVDPLEAKKEEEEQGQEEGEEKEEKENASGSESEHVEEGNVINGSAEEEGGEERRAEARPATASTDDFLHHSQTKKSDAATAAAAGTHTP